MYLDGSGTEHFVLPVDALHISVAFQRFSVGEIPLGGFQGWVEFLLVLHEFVRTHQRNLPGRRLEAQGSGQRNDRLAHRPAFGLNQHDTVGGSRAVNGRRRSVFQNADRLDVLLVQRVGVEVFDGEAVHHEKRRGTLGERSRPANKDIEAATGLAVVGRYLHPGHPAGERIGKGSNGCLHERTHIHRSHRTRQVALAGGAVTHYHHFVEGLGIDINDDIQRRLIADDNLFG